MEIATPPSMKLRAHTAAKRLEKVDACSEARLWILSLPPDTTARQAWDQCHRGDWMLWVLARTSGPPESDSRKRLVLCACEIARTALQYVPAGEDRPRVAIETAERWTRGEATIEEVRVATANATAAYAAAAAAAYAANASDRKEILAKCADIVRLHYRFPPRLGH